MEFTRSGTNAAETLHLQLQEQVHIPFGISLLQTEVGDSVHKQSW
jgi:hypothetical protein